MKKTTLFLFFALLTSIAGFAQGHETFDNFVTSGNSYQDGTFLGQDGSTWEYVQARGDADSDVNSGNQALMLGRNRNPQSFLKSGTISNGIETLQFSYRKAFSNDVNLEVYVNDILVSTVTTNGEEEVMDSGEIEVNIEGDVIISFQNPSGGGQVNIDDIIWTAMGEAPTLGITSPSEGAELSPLETPTIEFNVANFDISTSTTAADGDGYVQYRVNQGSLVDYFSTAPIELNGLTSGEHEVMLQLVDNDGEELNPEVTKTVTFNVNTLTAVHSIADLRDSDLEGYYTLSEEVVLTFQQDFRSQKYIQDATAAILIDDDHQIISTEYDLFDGITGLSGKLQEHNGLKQFIPIADAGAATSSDNSVDIVILNIADYMEEPLQYESQLIAFENVHFVEAEGDFATGQNYTVSDGVDETIMRTNFFDADFIGQAIPQGTQTSMVGLASHFNGDGQFFARSMEDLTGVTLSVEDFQKTNNIQLYPNPTTDVFYINTDSNAQVEVFSILGQKVLQKNIANSNNSVSVDHLKSGVYMVKVTQNGNTITKKLIKK